MNPQLRSVRCVWGLGISTLVYAAGIIWLAVHIVSKYLPFWADLLLCAGVAPAVVFYTWFGVDTIREAAHLQRELAEEAKPIKY